MAIILVSLSVFAILSKPANTEAGMNTYTISSVISINIRSFVSISSSSRASSRSWAGNDIERILAFVLNLLIKPT